MYYPELISQTCLKCGETYFGSHICLPPIKSEYEQGYDAGYDSVPGSYRPIKINLEKTCALCGLTYTGTHTCLAIFKSDYDRGYEAGKKQARREMGYSGTGEVEIAGE